MLESASRQKVLKMEMTTKTRMCSLFSRFIRIMLVICRKVIRIAIVLIVSLRVLWDSLMMMILERRSALRS